MQTHITSCAALNVVNFLVYFSGNMLNSLPSEQNTNACSNLSEINTDLSNMASAQFDKNDDSISRVFSTYKPRGRLARALYEKEISDQQLRKIDKNTWYSANLKELPEELADRFCPLSIDKDTNDFLEQSEEKSDWVLTQIWHSIAKLFLQWFMTQTSINGLLGRGSMFVMSETQFRTLLGVGPEWVTQSLLDLGAGDGATTARIAPAFNTVYVTEMSGQMRNILQRQHFRLLDIDSWHENNKFDVITCLNLLDRCDRPLEMLTNIRKALASNGKAIIALVLPFTPYVETGTANHKPNESLDITGKTFEQQVHSFWQNVLVPIGFDLESWSRVPYLCEGDINQSYYFLDDAIFVIKPF